MRGWPGCSGAVPRIQTLRRPFFSSMVVMVAVETRFERLDGGGVEAHC